MSPIHVEHARSRITDLRTRLADISDVLRDALAAAVIQDDSAHIKLQISIRALQAVSADLESVCDEHLTELRARSEVESGEFDSE